MNAVVAESIKDKSILKRTFVAMELASKLPPEKLVDPKSDIELVTQLEEKGYRMPMQLMAQVRKITLAGYKPEEMMPGKIVKLSAALPQQAHRILAQKKAGKLKEYSPKLKAAHVAVGKGKLNSTNRKRARAPDLRVGADQVTSSQLAAAKEFASKVAGVNTESVQIYRDESGQWFLRLRRIVEDTIPLGLFPIQGGAAPRCKR